MTYSVLLFDVDDTLLDFQTAEHQALLKVLAIVGVEMTPAVKQRYRQVDRTLWRAFERGDISRDDVVNQRFGLFFKEMGMEADSLALEKEFQHLLGREHQLLGNSLAVIRKLSGHADMYIVSNAPIHTQKRRLKDSQLLPYFNEIFVSEAIGCPKPMKGFFDHVFQHIPDADKKRTAIVGDSLASDIQGGRNAGIDTIWLKAKGASANPTPKPTYEITKLEELLGIMKLQ